MHFLRTCAFLPLALAGLVAAKGDRATPPPRVFSLNAAPECPRRLPKEGRDVYEIDLLADQYLAATFDQLGADVAVEIVTPGERRLPRIDSMDGAHGPEEVHLVSTEAGRYRFEVTSTNETAGDYCPRLNEVRRPTPRDRHQAAADRDLYAGSVPGLSAGEAEARYRTAIPLFAQVGDRYHQAVALFLLADLVAKGRHPGEEIGLLDQAQSLFQAVGDRFLVIHSLFEKGDFYNARFDFSHATEAYQNALDLADRPELKPERARALHDLGYLYYQVEGKSWQALGAFHQAIELWRQLDGPEYRENEANSLTGRGWVYDSTGDWENALAAHQEALALRQRYSSPDKQAVSYHQIGVVELHTGRLVAALGSMKKALKLAEAHSGPHDRAATLNGLGRVYAEIAHRPGAPERSSRYLQKAQDAFRKALDLYVQTPRDTFGEAITEINLGGIALDFGKLDEARQRFEQALALARAAKNRGVEARALSGLAEVASKRGDLAEAQSQGEAALDLYERLRAAAVRTDLQTSYLAANINVYNLLIRILMEMDRRQPGKGYACQAFERSEQSRARALLDALRESGDRQAGVPEELLRERQRLRDKIAAIDRQRGRLDTSPAAAAAFEQQISELIDLVYDNNAKIDRWRRAASPASPASPNITCQQARQLLDPDTLLLEYSFGRQSYLWAVSAGGVESFELSGSDQLEPLLSSAAETLSSENGPDDKALRRLSDLLLGPVAGQLSGKRLLIAAAGKTQYVPFGALPDPTSPSGPPRPLLVDHEIDYIPSLAVLAELRKRKMARAPAPLPLAVLADPVFDWRDQRLPPGVGIDNGEAFLPRLRAARKEAEAIIGFLPKGQAFKALDFAATRDLVTGGRMGSYRILHFATHGDLKIDHPELSALIFSRLDRQGRPRDGSLRVADLQGLDLPADLVVLSACSTALGRETPGEGLVGLPQAFLTAGASRVVVSLWRVEDFSTAALMAAFYRRILVDHRPPGAALREAQLEVRAKRGTPRDWAGFVLQGDWR